MDARKGLGMAMQRLGARKLLRWGRGSGLPGTARLEDYRQGPPRSNFML